MLNRVINNNSARIILGTATIDHLACAILNATNLNTTIMRSTYSSAGRTSRSFIPFAAFALLCREDFFFRFFHYSIWRRPHKCTRHIIVAFVSLLSLFARLKLNQNDKIIHNNDDGMASAVWHAKANAIDESNSACPMLQCVCFALIFRA